MADVKCYIPVDIVEIVSSLSILRLSFIPVPYQFLIVSRVWSGKYILFTTLPKKTRTASMIECTNFLPSQSHDYHPSRDIQKGVHVLSECFIVSPWFLFITPHFGVDLFIEIR